MNHPLSRKQLWRRQTKTRSNKDHDFLFENGVKEGISVAVVRTQSLPTVGTFGNFHGLGQHVWGTTGNLHQMGEQNQSMRKKVSFRNTVKILLIPDRTEYQSIDVMNDIWFDETDYWAFKQSAIRELKAIMASRNFDSKQAQECLYQPGFHIDMDLTIAANPIASIPSHPLIFGGKDVETTHQALSPPTTSVRNDDECDDQQHINNNTTTM